MNSIERQERIKQLFGEALECDDSKRAAFLAEACGDDSTLRRELESLLGFETEAANFIEKPAVHLAAEMLASEQAESKTGRMIGAYRVISKLGAGGMGEVWLAEDPRLKRKIALKLLPAHFTADAERVRRFEREARAASALNHPNILTIHEIGQASTEAGGVHFIATEFIDGQTLRQRVAAEKPGLNVTLDLAIQMAAALAAAHEAGIIHRDIKPENVMVRRDGLVKVLDFGLAKLAEQAPPAFDREAPTLAKVKTDPGTVMGTPQYMSPEQARGVEVDARTDIFSLGVVLYELIAGRAPFAGGNALEVVSEILKTEPAPLAQHAPEIPAELQRIVSKALRKDRDERYQTSKDLLLDLRDCREELAFAAKLERAGQAEKLEAVTEPAAAAPTNETAAVNTTSSASIILAEIKRHKRGVTAALAVLVLLLGGVGNGLYRALDHYSSTPTPSALKITRLTSTGKATRAAISPDGKYVVYAQDDGGQQSLWVTQVAAASNVQIVPSAQVSYVGITFARDGNFIYYVRTDKENPNSALWHLPVLGGNARKILVNIQSPITLSPDDKQLAFVRGYEGQKESALMVASADGSEEKKLAVRKSPDLFSSGPAWSPDGKTIACVSANRTNTTYRYVVGVRVSDGAEQPITSHRWDIGLSFPRVAWLPDNSGILATALEESRSLYQIWYLSWPGDEARRIVNDLNSYTDISLATASDTLAAIQSQRVVNLWVAPDGEASRARQITSGADREDGVRGLNWTPDGRIVYRSVAGGNSNVWIMATDGAGNKQLSANAAQNEDLAVSLDGRYIVWASLQTRNGNLWRMEIDGGNPKQLTNGDGEFTPQVSPDGKCVVYWSVRDGMLWKIPIDGGDPVQVTDKAAVTPVFSTDCKLIACNYWDEASGRYKIAVIPFAGGPPVKIFDELGGFNRPLQWMPDGRAIAFIRTTNGVSNLWAQPLAGGAPKQLTEFKDQRIFNFAWSRDGKQLALSRGVVNSDVVLLSGFK